MTTVYLKGMKKKKSLNGKDKDKKQEIIEAIVESKCPLMRLKRDCLVSLLMMLGMKGCARLDSAMSEMKGRDLLLEMMGSGDVWYEGSKDKKDFIRGDCLVWLGKRRLSLLSLSCTPCIVAARESPIDVTSDMVVNVARNSHKLKALYLRRWRESFTAEHMAEVATHCPDVESLYFTYDEYYAERNIRGIEDAVVIAAVGGMRKLKNVFFPCSLCVTNVSLVALSSHCPHIIRADITGCENITDEGLTSFTQGCSLIEDLSLHRVGRITDVGIKAIANGCKFIKSLDISHCFRITDESIKLLAQQCSLLEKIDLSHCQKLTDIALTYLSNYCPGLTHVSIFYCKLMTSEAVIHLVKTRGSNLHSLDVGESDLLTDLSVLAIADNCPLLTRVKLFRSKLMTDEGVIHLVRTRGQNLSFLDVGLCQWVTDLSLIAIAENCPHLIRFICSSNFNITDASVMRIAEGCRELTHVNISWCKLITDVSLDKFGEFCPLLENISLYSCPLLTQQGRDTLKQKIPNMKVQY